MAQDEQSVLEELRGNIAKLKNRISALETQVGAHHEVLKVYFENPPAEGPPVAAHPLTAGETTAE